MQLFHVFSRCDPNCGIFWCLLIYMICFACERQCLKKGRRRCTWWGKMPTREVVLFSKMHHQHLNTQAIAPLSPQQPGPASHSDGSPSAWAWGNQSNIWKYLTCLKHLETISTSVMWHHQTDSILLYACVQTKSRSSFLLFSRKRSKGFFQRTLS